MQIRDQIKKHIASWGPGKTEGEHKFRFFDTNDQSGVIILPKETIDECWNGAYKPALDRLAEILEDLKKHWNWGKYEKKPVVVASGGSLMNEALNERVDAMVKAAGFGPVFKVNQQGLSHE